MKKSSKWLVKILNKVIAKESDSVCCVIGYQPYMPDSVKQFKSRRSNGEDRR